MNERHNPDVLSCLANLSNDEVFTPPKVANEMLDLLPPKLFKSPTATFLDVGCKSGVFLREIAKRLIAGLAEEIPDLQARVDHILHSQLFGVATTELTSLVARRTLYCSKYPNGRYSASRFETAEGNIRYRSIPHDFVNGRCRWCGASGEQFGAQARKGLESHAYEFIHTDTPERIFNMKFDVIVGNPPYQLSDGGAQASARPIYNKFVEQALKLQPRYLTMIIPARWYGGGKGLDDFRALMILDRRIRVLHDCLDAAECFPGVEIKGGVCYFLWDRDNAGTCEIFTHNGGVVTAQLPRYLHEEGSDVFIRYEKGIDIYHKVLAEKHDTFDTLVSSQKPFGLRTFVHGRAKAFDGSVELYERGGVGYVARKEITKNDAWIDKIKVFISAAYNAGDAYPHQIIGKPILGKKGSCCTETYIVVGPMKNEAEAKNVISYMRTRFFRFLVMLKKTSQHAAASVYQFVPLQDFSKPWTDAELYAKYGLTKEEIAFIESMIKPME